MSASSHDDGGMTSGDEYSSQGLSVAQRAARWGEQVRANTGPPLSRLGNVFGRAKSKEPRSMPPVPPPKLDRLRAKTAAGEQATAGDSPITSSPSISAALLYIDNPPDLSPISQRPVPSIAANNPRSSHEDEERDEITPTNTILRRAVTADPTSASRRTSIAATIRPVSGAPSVATIKNSRSGSASGHTTDAEESPAITPEPHHVIPATNYYNPSNDSFTSPSSSDLHASDMDSHRHPAASAVIAPERARLGTSDLPFTAPPPPSSFSPTPNLIKKQKRRSMSLDLSQLVSAHKSWQLTHHVPPTPPTALAAPSGSVSSASLASREEVRGIIGASTAVPSSSGHASDAGSRSFRDRLAALNLANSSQHPSSSLPPPPPSHPSSRKHGHHQPSSMAPGAYSPPLPSRRPAAVSMQSLQQSLVPAATTAGSVALGFGKRAYDRVEKLWGGSNSSASSSVGGPSTPSKTQRTFGTPLLRVRSNDARAALNNALTPERKPGVLRRTPDAPSGNYSIHSTDEDSSVATGRGAELGPCLRPGKVAAGYGQSGLVFGRLLADCVRDTRTVPRVLDMSNKNAYTAPAKDVEQRLLPAFVVRCSQHMVRWGVEEEGLFR